MKKVVLIFPDVNSLAESVTACEVSNAEVDTRALSLIGYLQEEQIAKACMDYGATILTPNKINEE